MATFIIIGITIIAIGSGIMLALVQNARDEDEAWEKAIMQELEKNKSKHDD